MTDLVPNATAAGESQEQPLYLAAVGVLCAVISAFCSMIGLLLMKVSTEKERHLKVWRRWRFLLGFFVNILFGVTLTPVALALAPLAVCAPMGSLQLVFAAWFAARGWIVAKERAGAMEYVGMLFCVVGVVLASVFGPTGESQATIERVGFVMTQAPFIVVTAVSWTVIFGWLLVQKAPFLRDCKPAGDAPITAFVSGFCAGSSAAYSLVCVKTIMTAARLVIEGLRTVGGMPYNLWVCAAALAPVASLQVYLIEMTLGAGGTNYVIPIFNAMIMTNGAVLSGVVFDEFITLSQLNTGIFGGGIVVAMFGLAILARAQGKRARSKVEPADGASDDSKVVPKEAKGDELPEEVLVAATYKQLATTTGSTTLTTTTEGGSCHGGGGGANGASPVWRPNPTRQLELSPMRSPGSDKPLLSSPAAARTPSDVGSPAAGADAADHVAALQRERAAAVRTAMANQLSAQQHEIASLRGAAEVTGPLPPVVRGTPQVMRGGA